MTPMTPPPAHSPDPPYLTAALLCDDILEEKNGRLSIIRVVTEVTVFAVQENAPEAMPVTKIPVVGLFSFNAGGKPGLYQLHLTVIEPGGTERQPSKPLPVELRHDYFTMNVVVRGDVEIKTPGVYWIRVVLDDREVTRLPLNIRYESQRKSRESASAQNQSRPIPADQQQESRS